MDSDTVLSLASLDLREIEAFLHLMFLAAQADGMVTEEERVAFRTQVVAGTVGLFDAKLAGDILSAFERQAAQGEPEASLEKIRAGLRDPRKRHAALVHAARIVLADSVLALDEVAFLERAVAVLGDPTERVADILHEARQAE